MALPVDTPIIDAHQHFWKLGSGHYPWLETLPRIPFRYGSYETICQDFLPPDYQAMTGTHNIVATVHMEAEWDRADPVAESAWISALNERSGWPRAVIGWAQFDRADIGQVLAGHAAFPLVRSIRQKPATVPEPDLFQHGLPGSMADPEFRRGYELLAGHGFHYDLQAPWWHLREAAELARDFPDTLIVLNHTGLPSDRSFEGLQKWEAAMRQFAAEPNTAVKISGIGVPGVRWTEALNGDIIRKTISVFGADRAMFASNFPVDSLCATLDEVITCFRESISDLPDEDQRKLLHDTALRIYRPVED